MGIIYYIYLFFDNLPIFPMKIEMKWKRIEFNKLN